MTCRSSVRAQARVNYCALAGKASGRSSDPSSLRIDGQTPSPNAVSARGGAEKKETKLTERARKLYEESAVPVHEIARLAGVTERTIYKYVAKQGWKKRYRVLPRGNVQEDLAAARANRGRHMQASSESWLDLSPVKGAGGRFICREDQDKPISVGLQATDPAAAKHAVASCGGAAHLAALAQSEAEALQLFERQILANEATNIALKNLREYREERARKGRSAKGDGVEPILMQIVDISLMQWEALLAAGRAPR
jgi:hypothetical protein